MKKIIGESDSIYTNLNNFKKKNDKELLYLLEMIENEIDSLDVRKRRIEIELYYRSNPETRPK